MNQLRKAKLASIHAAVILIKRRRFCYNAFPILAIYHTKCTCKQYVHIREYMYMGSGSRGGVRGTQDPCPPPLFLDQTEA